MEKPQKGIKLSAKPLPWPYTAKEARDRSSEEAARIVTLLNPVFDGASMSEADLVRRVGAAIRSAETILRHMEAQGASTRPE